MRPPSGCWKNFVRSRASMIGCDIGYYRDAQNSKLDRTAWVMWQTSSAPWSRLIDRGARNPSRNQSLPTVTLIGRRSAPRPGPARNANVRSIQYQSVYRGRFLRVKLNLTISIDLCHFLN